VVCRCERYERERERERDGRQSDHAQRLPQVINEPDIAGCFGTTQEGQQSTHCGYILLYQRATKADPLPVFNSSKQAKPSPSVPIQNHAQP